MNTNPLMYQFVLKGLYVALAARCRALPPHCSEVARIDNFFRPGLPALTGAAQAFGLCVHGMRLLLEGARGQAYVALACEVMEGALECLVLQRHRPEVPTFLQLFERLAPDEAQPDFERDLRAVQECRYAAVRALLELGLPHLAL